MFQICEMLKSGGTKHLIADQKVPYVVKGSQWVGYDDKESLKAKVRLFWAVNFNTSFCSQPLEHQAFKRC